MQSTIPLSAEFYAQPVVEVAQALLGKKLIFGEQAGIITETEAYRGADDPASHAFRGKTKRTSIMFGPPGFSYVYLIYGMYYCLNIVTGVEGQASGVLLRGLLLPAVHLDGPGKLCKYLGITKEHNAYDLTQDTKFCVTASSNLPLTYQSTPRIGIKKATDKLWRFVVDKEYLDFSLHT